MNKTEQAQAIATAEQAVANHPTNVEQQIDLGIAYFHAARYPDALATFQKAVELEPNNARAYNWVGRAYYYLGPPEQAITAYEHAIALSQESIDPYFGLGILYVAQLGDYEAGLAAFQRGLAQHPEEGFVRAFIGSTYARMGRFDEAIASLQQTIERQPDNAFAYSWLSTIYLYQRRYDDVIAACQQEISINDNHSARRVLGFVYDLLGRSVEAIEQLERSIALEPEDYEARGALARLYRTVGRAQNATEHYAIAAAQAQQDNEYGQACFAAVSGNTEQALTLLEIGLAKGQLQQGWARIDPEFTYLR
ncbi:MAG: tetratricopeptide repeat protein, partial [Caldilineaceae bacterium]|nr:tetratricopeptide repeat protein [Caldilineaceae bacterium]